jgi:hypothetical protein
MILGVLLKPMQDLGIRPPIRFLDKRYFDSLAGQSLGKK